MKQFQKLHNRYLGIKADCALVTAADKKYAPFLFNALTSIHLKFPTHPVVYVFDLGLTLSQRHELSNVPWIRLMRTEKFMPNWKLGWSWKPYILTKINERFVLYFDAANIVLYRPLELWFLSIQRHGYFVISNRQKMRDITPSNYWKLFDLPSQDYYDMPTFGAGLFGFDKTSAAGDAVLMTLRMTIDGLNLGRSAEEKNHLYSHIAIRDCICFRADQTLFNLSFYKHIGESLLIRDELRYCGLGGANDHRNQYLWYARRDKESMIYFKKPIHSYSIFFLYNRLTSFVLLRIRWHGIRVIKSLKSGYFSLSRMWKSTSHPGPG